MCRCQARRIRAGRRPRAPRASRNGRSTRGPSALRRSLDDACVARCAGGRCTRPSSARRGTPIAPGTTMPATFDRTGLATGRAGKTAAIQVAALGERDAQMGDDSLHRGAMSGRRVREAIVHVADAKRCALNDAQVVASDPPSASWRRADRRPSPPRRPPRRTTSARRMASTGFETRTTSALTGRQASCILRLP